MKCFSFFKAKTRSQEVEWRSAPASISTTRPVSTNGTGASRSSGSNSTKLTSKSSVSASSPRSLPALFEERAQNLRVFDLRELRNATNDYSRLLKIGEGGFGSVYKGFIKVPDGQGDKIAIAIKKLNQDGLQGHKQWLAEVQFLGVVDHPNLVKLIGYCAVDNERGIQRLLVYEFMPNKSLESHLFNRAYPVLPWNTRLNIAIGVAEGLRYLHEGLEVQVIYRDFKASNVLLDEDFQPKLSDFGLAREGPSDGHTHVSTAVVGTYGYAAPDYVQTGHLTIKSDVWSFGVVLFEILTGRRSLDRNRPRPEQKLLDWVKQFPVESRRFSMMIDPRLGNQYSISAARLTAKLANTCLCKNQKDRPSMSEVVESLKHAILVTETGDPTEPSEEQYATDSDDEEKTEVAGVPVSTHRRMLHLARMGESANAESRRKFLMMQRPSQT
uniref:Putative receptor-like protein kinase At5g47070 n=1 Tax=Anthurium amnicola TaxID=1678845 RepID=A0A1D1XS87_9ARAE